MPWSRLQTFFFLTAGQDIFFLRQSWSRHGFPSSHDAADRRRLRHKSQKTKGTKPISQPVSFSPERPNTNYPFALVWASLEGKRKGKKKKGQRVASESADEKSTASTSARHQHSEAQPPIHPQPHTAAFRTESIRRRWRRRSRPRCGCSTAASAASPPSTASSAPTSSAASPGSARTRPACTPTSSSPRPQVRAPPPPAAFTFPSPVSPQPNLICV